jgi:dTDP-glucose pyrophosphorylase/CBS domain-containing protein
MDCTSILVEPSDTLQQAMERIDRAASGIALVVDPGRRLLFTVTDGDLRRAMLHGLSLETTLADWAQRRVEQGNRRPTTAMLGTSSEELLRLMDAEGVLHVPLLDPEGRVVSLARRTDFVPDFTGVAAFVMAGGEGQRLRPLTAATPKPMLKVGHRPLIEHTVEQLRDAGIAQVSIATHYKAEHIVEHFGDGARFGVKIDYVNEDKPLGTAGALTLAEPWTSTLLVMNGDIHTRMNYRQMLAFHREAGALMTVAVRKYDFKVPYGVIETHGIEIRALKEKPTLEFFVNAGIYLLEPGVREHLNGGERLDMTELIDRLLMAKRRVVSFPVSEYWIDIGQQDDYAQVQLDIHQGRSTV